MPGRQIPRVFCESKLSKVEFVPFSEAGLWSVQMRPNLVAIHTITEFLQQDIGSSIHHFQSLPLQNTGQEFCGSASSANECWAIFANSRNWTYAYFKLSLDQMSSVDSVMMPAWNVAVRISAVFSAGCSSLDKWEIKFSGKSP